LKTRSNVTLIAGLVMSFAVLMAAISMEIGDESAMVFIHPVAIMVVVGGCVTAALIARPLVDLMEAIRVTWAAIVRPKDEFAATALELIRLSRASVVNPLLLDDPEKATSYPLIGEALQTLSMGFPKDEVRRHLERRRDDNETSLLGASDLFLWLGRLGPAFGLLGTLLGLISLLYYHMDSGDMTRVASSMGVALTATLYGVALSNLVFGPLGEYLHACAQKSAKLDEMVLDGALMLRERRGPLYALQALRVGLPRHALAEFDAGAAAVMGTPISASNSAASSIPTSKGAAASAQGAQSSKISASGGKKSA
jgi:chemotaxis protein MotA